MSSWSSSMVRSWSPLWYDACKFARCGIAPISHVMTHGSFSLLDHLIIKSVHMMSLYSWREVSWASFAQSLTHHIRLGSSWKYNKRMIGQVSAKVAYFSDVLNVSFLLRGNTECCSFYLQKKKTYIYVSQAKPSKIIHVMKKQAQLSRNTCMTVHNVTSISAARNTTSRSRKIMLTEINPVNVSSALWNAKSFEYDDNVTWMESNFVQYRTVVNSICANKLNDLVHSK